MNVSSTWEVLPKCIDTVILIRDIFYSLSKIYNYSLSKTSWHGKNLKVHEVTSSLAVPKLRATIGTSFSFRNLFPGFPKAPGHSNLLLQLLKLLFRECFARRPEKNMNTFEKRISDEPVAKLCYHARSVDILEELLVILDHQRIQVVLKAFESGVKDMC